MASVWRCRRGLCGNQPVSESGAAAADDAVAPLTADDVVQAGVAAVKHGAAGFVVTKARLANGEHVETKVAPPTHPPPAPSRRLARPKRD